jgi:hypothetical protein
MAEVVMKLQNGRPPAAEADSVKRPEPLENFWQIAFSEQAPGREKVRKAASLLVN